MASARHIAGTTEADSVTVLTVYVVALLAIPAPMVIAPLGTAGSPSTVVAMCAFALWVWFQLDREEPTVHGAQPVRVAAVALLLTMVAVYVHAMSHPISSDEISPADSGLLHLLGLTGIVLIANDGVANFQRLQVLAQRLVWGVGIVAALGIVQTITKQLWVDRIQIPGLTNGASSWALAARSGLARPSGTSTHPIEFGMVLTTTLPLAIAFARSAPRSRWIYRLFVGLIAICTVLAISRSAMICAAVAVLVMVAGWPLASKVRALGFALLVTAIVFLSVPGVLGTIANLFTGIDNDPSVQSRTGSYDVAEEFIRRSPFLGRGFGTFLPKYWILDNGYLGMLIEGGLCGFLALLILIVAGVWAARIAVRRAHTDLERELGSALVAAIVAGAAGLAFFDTFSFPQSAGIFFLLVGMAGAARRVAGTSSVEGVIPGVGLHTWRHPLGYRSQFVGQAPTLSSRD